MKKTKFFAFLFFLAVAVIFFQSTDCADETAPLINVSCTNSPQKIDKDGNATLNFHAIAPSSIKSIVYSVKSAGGSAQVISKGVHCSVVFHTDDVENFSGGKVTVKVERTVLRNGNIGLFNSDSAVASGIVLPLSSSDPTTPDSPSSPVTPTDPSIK